MLGELECVITLCETTRADVMVLFQVLIQSVLLGEIKLVGAVVADVMAGRVFDVLLFSSGVWEVSLATKAERVLVLASEVLF